MTDPFLIPEEVKYLVLNQKKLSVVNNGKTNTILEELKEENLPSDQEKAEKHSKSPQGEERGLWTPELSSVPEVQLSVHPQHPVPIRSLLLCPGQLDWDSSSLPCPVFPCSHLSPFSFIFLPFLSQGLPK